MAELIEELVFVFRGQDGGLSQALKSQETELKRLKTVVQEITKELKSAQKASKSLQDASLGDGANAYEDMAAALKDLRKGIESTEKTLSTLSVRIGKLETQGSELSLVESLASAQEAARDAEKDITALRGQVQRLSGQGDALGVTAALGDAASAANELKNKVSDLQDEIEGTAEQSAPLGVTRALKESEQAAVKATKAVVDLGKTTTAGQQQAGDLLVSQAEALEQAAKTAGKVVGNLDDQIQTEELEAALGDALLNGITSIAQEVADQLYGAIAESLGKASGEFGQQLATEAEKLKSVTTSLQVDATQLQEIADNFKLENVPATLDQSALKSDAEAAFRDGVGDAAAGSQGVFSGFSDGLGKALERAISEGVTAPLREAFGIDTSELEESVAEALQNASDSVSGSGGGLLGGIIGTFQQGVGQGLGFKYAEGVASSLQKELRFSLEEFGARGTALAARIGKTAGDRAATKFGIVEGLEGVPEEIKKIKNLFDEIIDEKEISRKISFLELSLGRLVDDLIDAQDLSTIQKDLGVVGRAAGSIAKTPVEGLTERNRRLTREVATPRAVERAKDINVDDLDIKEGVEQIVLGIGGFASKGGQSSLKVSDSLQSAIGDKAAVVPVLNTNTDLPAGTDQSKLRFVLESLKKLIELNITKGFNEDSVEAAAQAIAIQDKTGLPVSVAGYSAGGFVAQGAAEIGQNAGRDFRSVGIGTPKFDLTPRTTPEQFTSILGEDDGFRFLVPPNLEDAKFFNTKGGHDVNAYLEDVNARFAILNQIGLAGDELPPAQDGEFKPGPRFVEAAKFAAGIATEQAKEQAKAGEDLLVSFLQDVNYGDGLKGAAQSQYTDLVPGPVRNLVSQVPEQARQVGAGVANAGIVAASQPFRIRKRVQLADSFKKAEQRAEEIDISSLNLETAKSVTLTTGGLTFDPKDNGSAQFTADNIQTLYPGTTTVPVNSPFLNDLENTGKTGAIYSLLTGKDPRESGGDGASAGATIKSAQTAIELGASPDAIELAAMVLAIRKKYPDLSIQQIGYSGGGQPVEESIAILEQGGISDVKGVGIGTPTYGLTNTASRENYQSVMGSLDPLALQAFGLSGLPEEARDNKLVQRSAKDRSQFAAMTDGVLEPSQNTVFIPDAGQLHSLPRTIAPEGFQKEISRFIGDDRIGTPDPTIKGKKGVANLEGESNLADVKRSGFLSELVNASFDPSSSAADIENSIDILREILKDSSKKKLSGTAKDNVKVFEDFVRTIIESFKSSLEAPYQLTAENLKASAFDAEFAPSPEKDESITVISEMLDELASLKKLAEDGPETEESKSKRLELESIFFGEVESLRAAIKRPELARPTVQAREVAQQAFRDTKTKAVGPEDFPDPFSDEPFPAPAPTQAGTPVKPQRLPKLESRPVTEEELKPINVKQLQQLARELGLTAKRTRAELVEQVLSQDAKEVRDVISALKKENAGDGVKIAKTPPSTAELRTIQRGRDREKQLRDTLLLFQKAKGQQREDIKEIALDELNKAQDLVQELSKSTSAETRSAAGGLKGRLESIRGDFEGRPQPQPEQVQEAEEEINARGIDSFIENSDEFELDPKDIITRIIKAVAGIPSTALNAVEQSVADALPTPEEIVAEVSTIVDVNRQDFLQPAQRVAEASSQSDPKAITRQVRKAQRSDSGLKELVQVASQEEAVSTLSPEEVALRRVVERIINLRQGGVDSVDLGDASGLLGSSALATGKESSASQKDILTLKRAIADLEDRAAKLGLSRDEVAGIVEEIAGGGNAEGIRPLPPEVKEQFKAEDVVSKVVEQTLKQAGVQLERLPSIVEGKTLSGSAQKISVPSELLDRIRNSAKISDEDIQAIIGLVDRQIIDPINAVSVDAANAEAEAARQLDPTAIVEEIIASILRKAGQAIEDLPEVVAAQVREVSLEDGQFKVPQAILDRLQSGQITNADVAEISKAVPLPQQPRQAFLNEQTEAAAQSGFGKIRRLPKPVAANAERAKIDGAELRVPQEIFDRIQSGQLNEADVQEIIRAVREVSRTIDDQGVQLTGAESRRFGPEIEARVSTVRGPKAKARARDVEGDALAFAGRVAPEVRENVLKDAALSQLRENLGVGGAGAELALTEEQKAAFDNLTQQASRYAIGLSDEIESSKEQIIEIADLVRERIAEVGIIEILPADEIVRFQRDLIEQLQLAKNEIDAELERFDKLAQQKPQRLRRQASEDLLNKNFRREDLDSVADQFGVSTQREDGKRRKKQEIVSDIAQTDNLDGLQSAITTIKRQRESEAKKRDDQIKGAVQTAKDVATAPIKAERAVAGAFQQVKRTVENFADDLADALDIEPVRQVKAVAGAVVRPVAEGTINAISAGRERERKAFGDGAGRLALGVKDLVIEPVVANIILKSLPGVGVAIAPALDGLDNLTTQGVELGLDSLGFGTPEFTPKASPPAASAAEGDIFGGLKSFVLNGVQTVEVRAENAAGRLANQGAQLADEGVERTIKAFATRVDDLVVEDAGLIAGRRAIDVAAQTIDEPTGRSARQVRSQPSEQEAISDAKKISEAINAEVKQLKEVVKRAESDKVISSQDLSRIKEIKSRIQEAEQVLFDIQKSFGSSISGGAERKLKSFRGNLTKKQGDVQRLNNRASGNNIAVFDEAEDAGQDLNRGLAQGVRGNSGIAENAGQEMADDVLEAIKQRLGIRSPSTVTAEYGRNLVQGFPIGVDREIGAASRRVAQAFNVIPDKIEDQLKDIRLTPDLELVPNVTIAPESFARLGNSLPDLDGAVRAQSRAKAVQNPQQLRPVADISELESDSLIDTEGLVGGIKAIIDRFNGSVEGAYRERFSNLNSDIDEAISDLDIRFSEAVAAGDSTQQQNILSARSGLQEQREISGSILEGDVISVRQLTQLDEAEDKVRKFYEAMGRPVPESLGKGIAKNATLGVRALQGLGLALGGVFTVNTFEDLARQFGDFLRGVLTDYAAFQEQIQLFGVVSGSLDTAEFDFAIAKIKELGATTTKTAADAAEAAVELAKVGFSAEAAAIATETVIKVSEATSESILRSTEVVGATLNQFGLLSDNQEQLAINSQRVGDVLVTVANASATSIDSAGETFAYLATEANQANQSLEQTGALIALAANAGIKGSAAGTGLAEALRRLQAAAAASVTELTGLESVAGRNAVDAFAQLGIEATDAAGNLRPLTELIPEIRAGLEDKTPGDRGLILKALFGVQGGRAFNTLLSQSQEDIDGILSQMENAGGSTNTAASQLTQGFAGNLKLLSSAIDGVRNDIGLVLSDALNPFIEGLTGVLSAVGQIPDPILKAGAGAAAFAVVMTGLTAAIAAYSLAQELGIIATLKKTAVTTKNTISNIANLQSNKSLAQANVISRVASTDLTTVLRQLTGERIRDTGAVLGNTAALKGNAAAQAGNAVAAGSGVKQLELFGNAAEAAGGAASVAGKKATGFGAGAKNLATNLKDLGGNAVGGVTKGLKGMAPALGVAAGGVKALAGTAGPLVLGYAAVRTTVSLLGGAWLEMGKGARAANKAMEETQDTLDELRVAADGVTAGDGLSEFERAAKDAEEATGESLGGVIGLLDKFQQAVINFDGGDEEGPVGNIKRIGVEALKNLNPLTLFVNQVSKLGTIRGRAQKSNDIAADKLVNQTAQDLEDLFGTVNIDLAGSTAQELQKQINSLDPDKLTSLEKGLAAIQAQTKSIDISTLDKGTGDLLKNTQGQVGKLSNLIRSATDDARAIGETVDATVISGITEDLSKATDAIAQEETRRLTRVQKSLNDGTISTQEAEAQRLAIQQSSTEQRLKLEQDAQAKLQTLLDQSLDASNGINFTDEALTQIDPALEGVQAKILETEGALAESQGSTLAQSASRRLEGISKNVEDQLQAVTRGEQQKLLAISQSEAAGTITAEQAAARRAEITSEAIEQQIRLEQIRVERLKALSFADQESEDARVDAVAAAEDKILQLQIQAAQNATEAKRAELERQVDDKVSAEDKAVEAAVKAEREAQLEIARLLDAGAITAEEAERRKTAASVAGVNARLTAENARLAALEGQGVQADAEVEKARREAISQSQDAIIGLIQERVDTQKRLEQEAVDALKKAQDEAVAELEAAEQERTLLLKERELQLRKAGGNTAEIERQLSEEALDSERKQLQERLRLQNEFVAQLERAQAEIGVDNEDAIRDAKRETTTLSIALVDNEIAAQNQLTEKVLANLDKEAAARQRQSDAAIASIQRQQSLFDSRIAVANSLQSLEETRLRNAASLATSETTRASIEKQIAELQLSTLAKRQEAERISLELAQKRALIESQIEIAKARADVARAEAQGATPEEVDALKQVLGLQIQAASDLGELQANERAVLQNNQLGEEDSAQTALTLANRGLADAIKKEGPETGVRTIRSRTIRSGGGKSETEEDRLNKERDKEAQNARGRADAFDSTVERAKAISQVGDVRNPDISNSLLNLEDSSSILESAFDAVTQAATQSAESLDEIKAPPVQQFFTGTSGQAATPVGETFSVAERGPELATDPRTGLTRLFNQQAYLRSDVPLVIRNATDTRKLLAQDGALNPSAISNWVQRQQQTAPSILSGQIASEQLSRVNIGSSHSPPGQSNGGVEILRAMYQQNAELVRRMRSIQTDLAGNRANTQGAAVELTRVRREIQAKPTSLSGMDYRTGALR